MEDQRRLPVGGTGLSRVADLESYVGRTFAASVGADRVSQQAVRHLTEALDWDWPDVDGAGSPLSVPLSTYSTFGMPAYRKRGEHLRDGALPPFPFHDLPLPGSRSMGVNIEVRARTAMRFGDLLTTQWSLRRIRAIHSRLGPAILLDLEAVLSNESGEVVAIERVGVLNFDPTFDEPQRPLREVHDVLWETGDGEPFDSKSPRAGQILSDVELRVSLQRLAMIQAANRDFAPIHFDFSAAAEIGASAPVLNTMCLVSLTERLGFEAGGPGTRAIALGPLRLHAPTPSGGVVRVRGRVVNAVDVEGGTEVDIDVSVGLVDGGATATGQATFFIRSEL